MGLPVLAAFGLTADYPGAQRRHYRFLLDGLVDAAHDLERRGVAMVVRLGRPDAIVPALAEEAGAAMVVGDENPVRVAMQWRKPRHALKGCRCRSTWSMPMSSCPARTSRLRNMPRGRSGPRSIGCSAITSG